MRASRPFAFGVVVVVIGSCVSLLAPLSAADPKRSQVDPVAASPAADRVAELERRVEELSRENARLKQEKDAAVVAQKLAERRVTNLRRLLDRRPVQLDPPLNLRPTPNQVPENWSPREFNGIRFYVIPIEGGQGMAEP